MTIKSNKSILIIIILMLTSYVTFSKNTDDTIKIEYKMLHNYSTTETHKFVELFNFIGVEYMEAIITGNLTGKNVALLIHEVADTSTTDTIPLVPWFFENDTLTISFTVFAFDGKIKFKIVPHPAYVIMKPLEYTTFQNHYLQRATLKGSSADGDNSTDNWHNHYLTTEKTFPVMGFRPTIDACVSGDPFFEVHPNLWQKEFGIKDYIYFEIKFID